MQDAVALRAFGCAHGGRPGRGAQMSARIDAFLQLGREQNASDIHIAVGMPPVLRIHGEVQPVRYRDINADEARALIFEILTEQQKAWFNDGRDLDFSQEKLAR